MSKALTGKRWFEAQGRRAQSMGFPMNYKRSEHQSWPMWARCAWARGWVQQQTAKQATECIVQSFEDEARRTGRTLRQTVSNFLEATP